MRLYDFVKKYIITPTAYFALVFTLGCNPKPVKFLEGKVLEELGTVPKIVEEGSTEIKKDSDELIKYIIKVDTLEGVYTMEIKNSNKASQNVYNLAAAIEEGTRVKFPSEYGQNEANAGFSSSKIGVVMSKDITILDENK